MSWCSLMFIIMILHCNYVLCWKESTYMFGFHSVLAKDIQHQPLWRIKIFFFFKLTEYHLHTVICVGLLILLFKIYMNHFSKLIYVQTLLSNNAQRVLFCSFFINLHCSLLKSKFKIQKCIMFLCNIKQVKGCAGARKKHWEFNVQLCASVPY